MDRKITGVNEVGGIKGFLYAFFLKITTLLSAEGRL
jgi:hypothetical protein